MISADTYTLAAASITTALTNSVMTAITSLNGMSAANITATLLGGTGGTTVSALVQTTMNGTTWLDVARFDFNTADSPPAEGTKYCVLQTNSSKGVTAYAALSAEGVNDGLLGYELRAVLTSTGTYSNTTLEVHVTVH